MHISRSVSLAAAALLTAGHVLAQVNNDCSGAIVIGTGPTAGSNVGATTSTPAWPCGAGANDVWYQFNAPSAGQLTASLCGGASFDSTLQIFDGAGGCGALVSLACNDDFCGLQSQLSATVAAAGPCFIRVGGFSGATGAFTMNVTFGSPATVVSQGAGCGQSGLASFYEQQPAGATFDMTGLTLTMIPSGGGGYVVLSGPGTLVPVGSLGTPTILTGLLDDNSVLAGGTNGLTVGSNGWVAQGAGNSIGYTPDLPTMLSNPATAYYSWCDMNPSLAASGKVHYEESGTVSMVTYNGVYAYGTTLPCFIQFVIDVSTGSCTITWGAMNPSTTAAGAVLVGYSPGGPGATPPSTDLSTLGASPLTTTPETSNLQLTAIGRPVQGALATNFDVTTSNIAPTALIHVGVIGLSNPGLPLDILLGATGCFLNATPDIVVGPTLFPPTSVTWTALNLPALPPNFSGFQFYTMGAVLGTPLNAALGLGLLTTNGLQGTVGDI